LNQKAFYKIILDINLSPEKTKKSLADKRLTNNEKKIIESYLLIRSNKNAEAVKLLNSLPVSDLPFVEAQRSLLTGLALNNLSHFKEAEQSILKSIPIFRELKTPYPLFQACFNLYFIFSNTRRFDKMEEMIQTMAALPIETELQRIRVLRCQFDFYSELENIIEAERILKEIDKFRQTMSESDSISQLVCEFMYYVKLENYKRCTEVLADMKNYRKFHLTDNYNFNKKLLEHLTLNAPIYVHGDDFASTPILLYQVKVIQYLEEKNQIAAEDFWKKLNLLAPEIYREPFNLVDTKSLFSLCLAKQLNAKTTLAKAIKRDDASLIEAAYKLFTDAKGPLSKAEVYEYLWGEAPFEKDDLKKLSQLIARVRSKKGIEIVSRKGTYFLESAVDKKLVG
jgi:hypothetical protein